MAALLLSAASDTFFVWDFMHGSSGSLRIWKSDMNEDQEARACDLS